MQIPGGIMEIPKSALAGHEFLAIGQPGIIHGNHPSGTSARITISQAFTSGHEPLWKLISQMIVSLVRTYGDVAG